MTDDPIRLATARWRGLLLIQNALNNLIHHVDDKACWDSLDRPLAGIPAVLVGAGPSLDESIDDIRALEGRCFLAVVNTALPTLRHHGIQADMCVTLENLDMTHQLKGGGYRYLACGLASHPHNFRACSFFVIDECPNWIRIAEHLGTEPMPTGPSALCFGVGLLRRLGAPTVTLVGADLAVYPGSPMYARHSGWEAIQTELQGDTLVCSGTQERKDHHWKHNIPAPNDERTGMTKLPAIGGGEVDTLPEFRTQHEWLSARAKGGERLLNMTKRGAAVGFRTSPEAFEAAPLVGLKGAPAPYRAEKALIDIRAQARAMEEWADKMLRREFDPLALPPMAPVVEGMMVPDLIAMRQDASHLDRAERYTGTYTIAKAAAKRLQEVVG